MRDNFYHWLILALFGFMFFGATVARIETSGVDTYGLIGSFVMGLCGIIGCANHYREAAQSKESK